MVSYPDSPAFHDLVQILVQSAADANARQKLGQLLPRLDEVAVGSLNEPVARSLARTRLSEVFLVALGTDAAHRSLSRAVDESDRISDVDGRADSLVEAAQGASSLGSLGADLLSRIEGHAAALEPSAARARLFATLSVAYGRAKDAGKAAKTAVRAMNGAEKIEEPVARVFALCQVATVLNGAHASRMDAAEAVERARAVAKAIEDDRSRARATVEVVATLGRLGRAEDALNLLQTTLGIAEPAPAPAVAEIEELQDSGETEPASLLDEVEELTEEVVEIETQRATASPAARPTPSVVTRDEVVENAGVPEGFVDPTAGVKFPAHVSRRRRR